MSLDDEPPAADEVARKPGLPVRALSAIALAGVSAGLIVAEPHWNQSSDIDMIHKQVMHNFQNVAGAVRSFAATEGRLPADIRDVKTGQPLLSWRVELLRHLAEDDLLAPFALNEPWDSPTNIKLLGKMPREFRGDRFPNTPAGFTHLRAFSGRGCWLDPARGRPLTLLDVSDPAAGTLLCVEARDPVEWTRPDDLPYDPDAVPPKLGLANEDDAIVATFDGKIRRLNRPIRAGDLRGAILIGDGRTADFLP